MLDLLSSYKTTAVIFSLRVRGELLFIIKKEVLLTCIASISLIQLVLLEVWIEVSRSLLVVS